MASTRVNLRAIEEQLSQVLLGFQNEREPNLVISVYLAMAAIAMQIFRLYYRIKLATFMMRANQSPEKVS